MAPISLPTDSELTALSTKQLVELYNLLTPNAVVKKFVDRKTAEARVSKVVAAAREARQIEADMAAAAKAAKNDTGDLPAEGGKAKKPKTAKEAKPERKSLSSELRALIYDGKTNAEIVNILKLVGNKKTYPGWVRSHLIRTGKLKATP